MFFTFAFLLFLPFFTLSCVVGFNDLVCLHISPFTETATNKSQNSKLKMVLTDETISLYVGAGVALLFALIILVVSRQGWLNATPTSKHHQEQEQEQEMVYSVFCLQFHL